MYTIKIAISEEILEKLQKRQKEKGIDSMAQCVREVIYLGLKSEGLFSVKNILEPSGKKIPKTLKIKESIWICEMRLLLRYLVENMPKHPRAINKDILDEYKKRSEEYVAHLSKESY